MSDDDDDPPAGFVVEGGEDNDSSESEMLTALPIPLKGGVEYSDDAGVEAESGETGLRSYKCWCGGKEEEIR